MSETSASGKSRVLLVRGGDTFVVDGRLFRLDVECDDLGPPWEENDCHGVVSEWTTREMCEGERVLNEDRGSYRYYDVEASMKIALKDWVGPEGITKDGTRMQRASVAVEADFERLSGWCNDQWYWAWLKVTLLDGKDKGEFESLGGVESDCADYISECAHELARELLKRVVTLGGTS